MTGTEGEIVYLWAKIRSWHLTPETLPASGELRTLCGRYPSPTLAREPEPPNGEATCETCFRIREARA